MVFSIFYVVGFTYKDKVSGKFHLLSLLLFAGLFAALTGFGLYPFATQLNKFPPNLAYICFGMIFTIAVSYLVNNYKLKNNRLFAFCNKCGMEMYLYQNYIFLLFAVILLPRLYGLPVLIQYVTECVFILIFFLPMAAVINKVNTYIIRFVNSLSLKSSTFLRKI